MKNEDNKIKKRHNPGTRALSWLVSSTQDQTAWDLFLSFYKGVAGLVAHSWEGRPSRNTPAFPDGTLHLTTNQLNLYIDI